MKVGLQHECHQLSTLLEETISTLKGFEKEQQKLDIENLELEKLRQAADKDATLLQREKLEREVSSQKTTLALNEAVKEREEAKLRLEDM